MLLPHQPARRPPVNATMMATMAVWARAIRATSGQCPPYTNVSVPDSTAIAPAGGQACTAGEAQMHSWINVGLLHSRCLTQQDCDTLPTR